MSRDKKIIKFLIWIESILLLLLPVIVLTGYLIGNESAATWWGAEVWWDVVILWIVVGSLLSFGAFIIGIFAMAQSLFFKKDILKPGLILMILSLIAGMLFFMLVMILGTG